MLINICIKCKKKLAIADNLCNICNPEPLDKQIKKAAKEAVKPKT